MDIIVYARSYACTSHLWADLVCWGRESVRYLRWEGDEGGTASYNDNTKTPYLLYNSPYEVSRIIQGHRGQKNI